MRPIAASLALLALVSFVPAQGVAWVVDADGGAGSDFVDIQPAIDAAASGDTVLVRSGTYSSFTVDGKSLQIVAEVGPTPRIQEADDFTTVRVQGLLPGGRVLVRGFSIEPEPVFAISVPAALVIENCAGAVWVEDVSVRQNVGLANFGAHTARVLDSDAVNVIRCDFETELSFAEEPGLDVVGSVVRVYDSALTGGEGRTSSLLGDGGTGGAGARVDASELFASGTVFQGGYGGLSTHGQGGTGGAGIQLVAGSAVRLLECTTAGGPGGPGNTNGQDGETVVLTSGTLSELAESSRQFSIESPVREGRTVQLDLAGEPGDFFALWYSQDVLGLYVDELFGAWLPGFAGQIAALGFASPTGELSVVLPAGSVPASVGAASYYAQAIAADMSAAVVLGAGSAVTVVNELVPAP